MVAINPIPHCLVPGDSAAAQALCSPNYDEFQSDLEIFELLQRQPASVLRITMPHACAPTADALLAEGSSEALAAAESRMAELRASPLTRDVRDVLFLYEIADPKRPDTRQIGLGGLAPSRDILTAKNLRGTIVRNVGVRRAKAQGRADLIQATRAIVGTVNNTVEDADGGVADLLRRSANSREADFRASDENGCEHKIWLLPESAQRRELVAALRAEPYAYVADGNHRSAAAAMLGLEGFLAVTFPASGMGLAPYNRLVRTTPRTLAQWRSALETSFLVKPAPVDGEYQPTDPHSIGFFADGAWLKLTPRIGTYDPTDAAASIDSAIVQELIFDALCAIRDPRDARLTFVGGNRDAAYLRAQVAEGRYAFAVTLAAVTMEQFVNVCRQRHMMPPKSTWFSPKIRSGLVMALLES